jgi:hypothetical protein
MEEMGSKEEIVTGKRVVLPYAPAPPSRIERWSFHALLAVYAFLFAALLCVPFWLLGLASDFGEIAGLAALILLLVIFGVALLIIPVRVVRRRPVTRRSIVVPIIASGLLLGGLVLGGGMAAAQLFAPATSNPYYTRSPATGRPDGYYTDHAAKDSVLRNVAAAAIVVWIAWSLVFGIIALGSDAAGLGMQLHRILIAGSVLELLVAVPAHIIVRRRADCCGGILTGAGICVGIVVALAALGPSVLLLFVKRCRQIEIAAGAPRG